ncbi:MAG: flavodoxin family protein [Methanoregula sp.]|jgi:multimeric flavodoxin WrbA
MKKDHQLHVVAFNGSARKNGNTAILINYALQELEKEGITTELVQLSGNKIQGCTACMKCFENRNKRCVIEDDMINDCIRKMIVADGIVFGSPVYFSDVPAEMKALIDRAGFVSMANGELFRRKVGAAAVAVRRTGAIHTADTLIHFLLGRDMILTGFPGIGMGLNIGDVDRDHEGVDRMKAIGQNMAWMMKLVAAGNTKTPLKPVPREKKAGTAQKKR